MSEANAGPRLGILLAAGEGTRMRSARAKPLHLVAGRSMLAHSLAALVGAGCDRLAVVIGPHGSEVGEEARRLVPEIKIFVQHERLGTAHAVLAARPALERRVATALVTYADTPLITAETLKGLLDAVDGDVAMAALAFEAKDPTGYGRLIEANGRLMAIREQKDASEQERKILRCNAGPIAISGELALGLLEAIRPQNAAGEYYLTDLVEIAASRGLTSVAAFASELEVMGVNDRVQLANTEAAMQARLRLKAMREGATLVSPETIFLSWDTEIGQDVVIEPHVFIGAGVSIADGATIHAFSHLEGARVANAASIGPHARLRPGADIGVKARIGNFVEIKAARIETGAKINHLSYIGDAHVGAGANIGAGTITCNYDGFSKFKTNIGAGAFIGSNSALVAPLSIGAGAYIGSGSVITDDVPADALSIGRGRQATKLGWAAAFRNGKSK